MKHLLYLISMVASSGFSQIHGVCVLPMPHRVDPKPIDRPSKLGVEDPEMEIAFPYAGNFEVLHWPHQGKEVASVVPVGFRGMVFQRDLPFLPDKGLQQLLCHGLPFRIFSGKVPCCPMETIVETLPRSASAPQGASQTKRYFYGQAYPAHGQ